MDEVQWAEFGYQSQVMFTIVDFNAKRCQTYDLLLRKGVIFPKLFTIKLKVGLCSGNPNKAVILQPFNVYLDRLY